MGKKKVFKKKVIIVPGQGSDDIGPIPDLVVHKSGFGALSTAAILGSGYAFKKKK